MRRENETGVKEKRQDEMRQEKKRKRKGKRTMKRDENETKMKEMR